MSTASIAEWAVPALGAGGLIGALIMRFFDKKKHLAEVQGINATTRLTDAQANAIDIGVLRELLKEVKDDNKEKTAQLHALDGRVKENISRVNTLEERERHNLTRVVVHEAWDQIAYNLLLDRDPTHPPPPPLRSRGGSGAPDEGPAKVTYSQTELNLTLGDEDEHYH